MPFDQILIRPSNRVGGTRPDLALIFDTGHQWSQIHFFGESIFFDASRRLIGRRFWIGVHELVTRTEIRMRHRKTPDGEEEGFMMPENETPIQRFYIAQPKGVPSMFERFQKDRALDRARQTTQRILSAQGEINAQSMAVKLIEHYQLLNADQRLAFFDFLATHFNPDPTAVQAAAAAYAAEPSASHLVHLCQVVEPQRQELLRRINRAPQGTAALVKMRQTLLSHLATQPALAVIDADMHHLLSSWFNPGFLELHQITWRSSAQLLESLIHHESVHAIDGWDDLRRRLQPDRRCYAFFHRQLPDEPLIFVEVALVPELATNVGRLIDKTAPIAEASTFKTAVFYQNARKAPTFRPGMNSACSKAAHRF
jgi:hypothetical protein